MRALPSNGLEEAPSLRRRTSTATGMLDSRAP